MTSPIPHLSTYGDADRDAALALRIPLLMLLYTVPPSERAEWLASLVEGLRQGVTQGVKPDRSSAAYQVGQRMALLVTEEGHA